MLKKEVGTFKINKEIYTLVLNEGVGILGIDDCYISVKTPENCLGYPDYVLLGTYGAYTLHRYLPPYILKKIETKIHEATIKFCKGYWKKITVDYCIKKYGEIFLD